MLDDPEMRRGDIYLVHDPQELTSKYHKQWDVTSFHEQIHVILSYNAKYGTKEQKAAVSRLITGGKSSEPRDFLVDAPGGEEEWRFSEEEFVQKQEPLMGMYARQRAMRQLQKRGWHATTGPAFDDPEFGTALVIEKKGVGWAHITINPDGRSAHMQLLRAEGAWRRGRGRETYNEVKQALKLMGVESMTAWSEEEPAGFWKKMGFKADRPTGIQYDEYGGGNLIVNYRIGMHPGSKRTPFYRRSARKIRRIVQPIMTEVMEEHNV